MSSKLHHAIQSNADIKSIKLLIDNGADINYRDKFGKTPLHLAAETGNIEIINLLLKRECQVNCWCNENCTPLHFAVDNGHIEVVNLLLKYGANVNNISNPKSSGVTPLITAVTRQNILMCDLLLTNGADVTIAGDNGCPIHYAAKGNEEILMLLVSYKADVESTQTSTNYTPLHIAIYNNNAKTTKALIKFYGSNIPDFVFSKKFIEDVIKSHNIEIIDTFIKIWSGKFDEVNNLDLLNYVFSMIIKHSHETVEEVLNLLIKCKKDINYRDSNGLTLLYWAVRNENVKLTTLVLENGADVNEIIDEGFDFWNKYTPLMTAVYIENEELVKLLLQYGADVNFCAKDKLTALHFAAMRNNVNIFKLLVKLVEDVEVRDAYGYTPLYYAIDAQNVETCQILLEYRTKDSNTHVIQQLDFTLYEKHKAIFDILRENKTE